MKDSIEEALRNFRFVFLIWDSSYSSFFGTKRVTATFNN